MPKVSLITLCYNQLENATKPFLESLYKYTNPDLFELIIVNNASTDGTKEFLDEFKKNKNSVKVIHNEENFGYAKGNNFGLKIAEGDFIFLLNNDLLFSPNWLEKFVEILENNDDIGLISCKTNYATQESQLATGAEKLTPDNYLEYAKTLTENKFKYTDSDRIIFFCIGLSRKVYEKVGMLDENFGQAWYEDDDYTVRTLMQGYKLAIAEDVFIYHNHSQTTSKLVKDGKAKELLERNKKYFEKKHSVYIDLKNRAEICIKNEFETVKKKHEKYKKLFNLFLPVVIVETVILIILVIMLVWRG